MKRAILCAVSVLPLVGCGAALTIGGVAIAQNQDDGSDQQDAIPAIAVDTPSGSVNDLIAITYRLTDPDIGDRANVQVEYRQGSSAFQSATSAFGEGAEGTDNLTTSATGEPHTFLWNTTEDLGFSNVDDVVVRITPLSTAGVAGTAVETQPFSVNNRFITTLSRRPPAAGLQAISIAVTPTGDVVLADGPGHRVVQLEKSSGEVSILAGTGEPGNNGDRILGSTAQVNFPTSVAADAAGDVLVVDAFNLAIRKIDLSSGFISNVAGPGFNNGEDVLATNALFFSRDLALDGSGNPFFTDDDKIRALNLAGTTSLSFNLGTVAVMCLNDPVTIAPSRVATVVSRDEGCGGSSAFSVADLNDVVALVLDTTGNERTLYYLEAGQPGASGFPRVVVANHGGSAVTLESFVTGGQITVQPGDAAVVINPASLGLNTANGGLGSFPDLALFSNKVLLLSSETQPTIAAFNLSTSAVTVAGTSVPARGRAVVVGSGQTGLEGDGLGPLQVQLAQPVSVGADGSGNIFISEAVGRIRVVAAPGGTYTMGSLSVPGGTVESLPNVLTGTEAEIVDPLFLTMAPGGDLLVTDADPNDPRSNRLFRVSAADASVTTVLGNGVFGNGGDGGPATSARVGTLGGPSASPDGGIVVVADFIHHRVRAVNTGTAPRDFLGVTIQPGNVETVAGTGIATVNSQVGDGGSPRQASFLRPVSAGFDARGLLYIGDSGNHRIRVCNPLATPVTVGGVTVAPNTIQTIAGTGSNGSPGNDGNGGAATQAPLSQPAVLAGADGNLFVLDGLDIAGNPSAAPRLRVVNLGTQPVSYGSVTIAPGAIATIVGSGADRQDDNSNLGDGGAPLNATFRDLSGASATGDGLVYVTDESDSRIRVANFGTQSRTLGGVTVAPNTIQTVIGNGIPAFEGDPSPVTGSINEPFGVVALPDGRVLFVDSENGAVRLANLSSAPRSFGGVTAQPGQMAIVGGSRSGAVTVGTPQDLAVDLANGIVIFSDTGNLDTEPAILQLDLRTRVVRRLAGTFDTGDPNDGGPALLANLEDPRGLTLSGNGLYFVDAGAQRVRFVNRGTSAITIGTQTIQPGNIASLVDGSDGDDDTGNDDGVALINSSLDLVSPTSISLGGTSTMWIADPPTSRVLRADLTQNRIAGVLQNTQVGAASTTGMLSSIGTATRDFTDANGNFTSTPILSGDTLVVTSITGGASLQINGQAVSLPVGIPIQSVDSGTALTFSPQVTQSMAGTISYRIERRLETRALAAVSSTVAYIAGRGQTSGGMRIFRVTYTGSTFTFEHIAGTGNGGWNGDNLAATSMNFEDVTDMQLDGSLLYVTDQGLNRLVAINTTSAAVVVADLTVAGDAARMLAGAGRGAPGFNGDAVPPELSLLNRPTGVATDANGIYLVDRGNVRLRRFQK